MARDRSIQLLRLIPGDSPVHRLWPGTKLGIVVFLGIVTMIRPTWRSVAVLAVALAVTFVAARVPWSALPLPPRWLAISLFATGAIAVLAGGEPDVTIGPVALGLGGLLEWLLLTLLLAEAFAAAALVGWTTHVGDLGGAVAAVAAPLRRAGIPVESAVATATLGLRCLPLILDEFRTLLAAWRNRRPLNPPRDRRSPRERSRDATIQAHDILVGAVLAALRRAREMGQAMEARGGLGGLAPGRVRLGAGDGVAVLLAVVASVVMLA